MPRKKLSTAPTAFGLLILALSLLPLASSAMPPTKQTQKSITGRVAETMNSGGYTYMRIENASGQSGWVAIPESKVEQGSQVEFYEGMVMKNFTSTTLNRTFDTVIFSPGLTNKTTTSPHATVQPTEDSFAAAVKAEEEAEEKQAQMPLAGQGQSGGSLGAIVPFEGLVIEKAQAENGYSVGEIFTKAEELNGKEVTVRGKVLKFSPMIMGRNWVHIQDGTGNAMKNQHDLVITTQDTAQEGDLVVAKGVVTADKDFGAGYRYDVLIEKATLTKEQ